MTVSAALARIYTEAPDDDRHLETLELRHPSFSKSYYITNSDDTFTAGVPGEGQRQFLPFPFVVVLPSSGDNGFQDLQISISSVDQTVVRELELSRDRTDVPITFTYRAYAESDLSAPGFELPPMSAVEVTVDDQAVTARVTLVDLVNRNFPNQIYTTTLFPMLGAAS